MQLQALCALIPGAKIVGDARRDVQGVAHDSRDVHPSDLFVCLVGANFDGHLFAHKAVQNGATALLVVDGHPIDVPADIPLIVAPDTRSALPVVASAVYGNPSSALKLVGVTGTNGKTTTTYMVAAILKQAGLKVGTIGTLGADLMGVPIPSDRTTPEADQLQSLLAYMRGQGAQAAVMEVSSHAIAQGRTQGCCFDAAAFTNLTQDHLDYHGTLDAYFETKLRLFSEYPVNSGKPFIACVNLDDPRGKAVADATRGRVVTYAQHADAEICALDVRIEPSRTAFRVRVPDGEAEVSLRLGGAFQVYNALAAIGVGYGLGIAPDVIAEGLGSMVCVPGRFEPVETGRDFHVVVDYAHTPDGLLNLLESARKLEPSRVIVVFGCGGDRDRTKRPIMGGIAGRAADVAIVTSDNPRTEDPDAIIAEIMPGMKQASAHVVVEPDRLAAISQALQMARSGDLVVIAGKGHEDYQEINGVKHHFDDREVVRELLRGRC